MRHLLLVISAAFAPFSASARCIKHSSDEQFRAGIFPCPYVPEFPS